MSESIKIKLEVANRLYPLTIRPEQEAALRKASSKIDEMIKRFEKSYEVRDKQDVLAMCALQFATIAEKNTSIRNRLIHHFLFSNKKFVIFNFSNFLK